MDDLVSHFGPEMAFAFVISLAVLVRTAFRPTSRWDRSMYVYGMVVTGLFTLGWLANRSWLVTVSAFLVLVPFVLGLIPLGYFRWCQRRDRPPFWQR